MPTLVSNVYPGSTTYTHEVALKRPNGQTWGLRLQEGARSMRDSAPQTNAPFDRINQFSAHLGRGWENFLDKQHMGYWDSKNAWTLTPAKIHPAPLMQWGRGLTNAEIHWLQTGVETEYKKITWIKLGAAGDPYLSASFTSIGVTAVRFNCMLRRIGNPGPLTIEVLSNNAGNPTGTLRQTMSVTMADVTDFTCTIPVLAPSPSFAYVAGTVYHVKFSSADTTKDNCWEVACNPEQAGKRSSNNSSFTVTTYAPYFRLASAGLSETFYTWLYDGAMYACTTNTIYINGGRGKATAGTSTTLTDSSLNMTPSRYVNAYLHIIRGAGAGQTRKITANTGTAFTVTPAWETNPASNSEYILYGTPWLAQIGDTGIDGFTAAAVGADGLASASGCPVVANGIVYFPQGDATAIRRMRWNASTKVHEFASETIASSQGTASLLVNGYDPADGPQVWRANNASGTGSGGAMTVSRANATSWGTNLAFKLPNGAGTKGIYIGGTSSQINGFQFHEGTLYVHKEGSLYTVNSDRAVERKYGAEDMPSINNGIAMTSSESVLYFSFWTNVMQMVGAKVQDTKLWLNNLPASRVGFVNGIESAFGFIFLAYNAGAGTSSVLAWNEQFQAWHEIYRAFQSGWRVSNIFWQPCEDVNPRLWIQNYEPVFMVFPRSPRPLADNTIVYQPEFIFETSTIDLLNSNSKYFGTLTLVSKNLSKSGHMIEVDYQTDNDVDTSVWMHAGTIVESPEGSVQISAGNRRKIRLRFRGLGYDLTSPPVIENFGLSLFERTEPPQYYTLVCKTSPNQKVKNSGADDHPPSDLYRALQEMNKRAEVLTVLSIDPELHGKSVTMYLAPRVEKDNYNYLGKWSGLINVYLFEEKK